VQKVQAQLAGQWETRFVDFLADHPDAAGELEELIKQFQTSTATAWDHAFAAPRRRYACWPWWRERERRSRGLDFRVRLRFPLARE
jgi:hypothetical protein